jgi:hypothetical protein
VLWTRRLNSSSDFPPLNTTVNKLGYLTKNVEKPFTSALDEAKLMAADPNTERLVKKAEAAFNVMPADTPEFDHYTPADWLLRNPAVLDTESAEVAQTLKIFETAISTLNKCLPTK